MKDDPTITAVREARQLISASVGHDPRKLVEYYRKLQERHRDRLAAKDANQSRGQDEGAA